MKTRLKRALGVILVLLTALLVYGVVIEPRLILAVDREPARLPHLPPSWEGQRVAVISDFHVGMWLDNSAMVQRAVQQIVAGHPAAVFLLGDFLNQANSNVSEDIHRVTEIMRPLAVARLATYAVLGNHDYGVTGSGTPSQPRVAARLRQALAALRVRVLQNSAVALSPPERPVPSTRSARSLLYIVGLGPHEANEDRPQAALHGVPRDAPRIVIMHDPDSFPQLPPGSAPLGIAGHTHCGQAGIPFVTHWALSLAEGHAVAEDGWNAHYGQPGNRLYVTCGLGLGVVPVRIDDPPQITVFTLHRG